MMQQLHIGNRFHSLAPDDPDNSDSDTEVISRPTTEQPQGDASSTGSGTEYFDVQGDAFYFQAKAEQPPREPWDVAHPLDFNDLGQTFSLIHQLDEGFHATKDISVLQPCPCCANHIIYIKSLTKPKSDSNANVAISILVAGVALLLSLISNLLKKIKFTQLQKRCANDGITGCINISFWPC